LTETVNDGVTLLLFLWVRYSGLEVWDSPEKAENLYQSIHVML